MEAPYFTAVLLIGIGSWLISIYESQLFSVVGLLFLNAGWAGAMIMSHR